MAAISDEVPLMEEETEITDVPPPRRFPIKLMIFSTVMLACSLSAALSWPHWWLRVSPWKRTISRSAGKNGQLVKFDGEAGGIISEHEQNWGNCNVNLDQQVGTCEQTDCDDSSYGKMFCCVQAKSFECSPYCFPGQATVQVRDRGRVPLAEIQVGEHVLVHDVSSELIYQPVLGFLHAFREKPGERSMFLKVNHARGTLRASENHVAFVSVNGGMVDKNMRNLKIGDELIVVVDGITTTSSILAIQRDSGDEGMFAPLTESGTIIVDGVIASNYATVGNLQIPHGAMHAAFFPLRAYKQLGLETLLRRFWSVACPDDSTQWICDGDGRKSRRGWEEMHPLPATYYRILKLDRLLSTR